MVRWHSSLHCWGLLLTIALSLHEVFAGDHNNVYRPCQDTIVRKDDGFSFGLVTATNDSFFYKKVQLSPCDKRLVNLTRGQVAVFRPKVDEISLLVINITQFNPEYFGGYAVAFAGSRYAAVSKPVFLANRTYHVTSVSLDLNFDKGRLVSLLWKTDKCASCPGSSSKNSTFVCLNGEQCAIRSSKCEGDPETTVDCSLSIQATFSGTDKYQETLTSWYQMSKIQQYSLYSLYSNLKSTLLSQFRIFS